LGYNNLFPIAEAKNAAANEIYTQNFEFLTGAGVDAVNRHTGKQSYSVAYTVSFTPPAGKSYVISWFQLNGSVWEYHRENYTGSKAFPGGYNIDDIAVYPADAQLSIFTYDPTAGLTSGIDAKGETTFYEYDNYQRLMNVKDKDGNIVKHTDYHYQQ
jgi:YD repeat-containing protein